MHKILRNVAFLSTALLCCASSRTHADALPIYPYWNAEQLPMGPVPLAGTARMPMPTGSAVVLASGYLIASAVPMGDVAEDPSKDPTVYLFDGKDWITGRYVDYDGRTKLALIRADIGGRPVTLAGPGKAHAAPRLVGIPWAKGLEKPIVRSGFELKACDAVPDWMSQFSGRRRVHLPAFCFSGRVITLAGGALLDADGKLAGLQVNETGAPDHVGASSDDIRAFVQTYFSSWGSGAKNKPTHLYQK